MTKPRLKPSEVSWFQAYERIRQLPEGTKLKAHGITFILDHVLTPPDAPVVVLKYRQGRNMLKTRVRRDNPLLVELQT